jgi:hypothetical protein
MKNYKYVLGWSSKTVDDKIVKESLDYAWRYTPSKNNFMNYSVFVLGPDQKNLKKSIYYKCLKQQSKANGHEVSNQGLLKYEKRLIKQGIPPLFKNIKDAPYLLIYTSRVADELNEIQQNNINYGMVYEQTFPPGTEKYESACNLSRIEIGMFATNFATKCLESNIDISYVLCMPTSLDDWSEPEWSFMLHNPILIQLAGHGKTYRRSILDADKDLKPNFDKIVNIIGKK